MSEDVMLTTTDNPYDPFIQFDEWYAYDIRSGHDCCGVLDRMVRTSESLSDVDQLLDVEQAIDELLEINPNGLFKKVTRD